MAAVVREDVVGSDPVAAAMLAKPTSLNSRVMLRAHRPRLSNHARLL